MRTLAILVLFGMLGPAARSDASASIRGGVTAGTTLASVDAVVRTSQNTAEVRLETDGPDSVRHVPDFICVSLDDSTRAISSETLKGKVYIVDFWATWCPPCVEELPLLTRLYERWHEHGFEILSLSFDSQSARVKTFREKRFRMPWLHSLVTAGFSDVITQVFGVQNIPHVLVVGRDGRILAEDDNLRGPALERVVEAAMQ